MAYHPSRTSLLNYLQLKENQVVINRLRQRACNKTQPDDFSWGDGLCATGGNVMGHASTCRILFREADKTCIAIMIVLHITCMIKQSS